MEERVEEQGQSKMEEPRKVICRYGRGCTHFQDPSHKDLFWHPPTNSLTEEQLKSAYICNECGYSSLSLQDLQTHLRRKTAWSNASIVGCRISCLVDNKEWHEGFVLQYHKSGKHDVDFRLLGERRWLTLKKVAFYIVERSKVTLNSADEFKENELDSIGDDGLAPLEVTKIYQ